MGVEELCLTWDDHHNTLIGVFEALLESSTLVDCTIAAEGQYLKAHKVVLSACSPYFEMLFTQENEKNPIVVLKDIKFQDLRALIDFIYRGKVQIPEDRLGDFTDAAESLQIKGLGGGHRKNNLEKKGRETPNLLKKNDRVSPIARKRPRNSFPVTGENSGKAGSLSPFPVRKNPRSENTSQIQNSDCLQPVLPSVTLDPSPIKVRKEPSEVRSSSSVTSSCVSVNELEPMAEIFLPDTLVEPKSEVCEEDMTLIGCEGAEEDKTIEEGADYDESENSDFSSTHGLLKQESNNSFLIDPVLEHSNTGPDEDHLLDTLAPRAEAIMLRAFSGTTSGACRSIDKKTDLIPDARSRCEETVMDQRIRNVVQNSAGATFSVFRIREPSALSVEQHELLDTPTAAPPDRAASSSTGAKSQTCSEFAYETSSRERMRIHTDVRLFTCGDCGKAFKTSGYLRVHRRIHTGEMPFHCQHCPMRFIRSIQFHRHMKKMHCGLAVGNAHRPPGRPPRNSLIPSPME